MGESEDLRRQVAALRDLVGRAEANASISDHIFESIPFPIQVYGPDGTSLRMNEAQRRLLGLESKQTGVGVFNIRTDPFAIANGGARQFEAACRGQVVGEELTVDFGGFEAGFESTRRCATFEHFMFPVYDQVGGLAAVVSFARDITQRKHEEQELRLNAERFEIALRASGTVVFNQDKDLRYTWIHNPHPAFDSVGVLGKTDYELFPREHAERLSRILRRVLETGARAHEEVELQMGDHQSIYILDAQAQRDSEGNLTGLTCAATDVTRPVLAERRTQELSQALLRAQKLESLGLLAGGIAHDFNNLLVAVLGNAEIALMELEDAPESEVGKAVRGAMDNIVQAAIRGSGLTRQLLTYCGRAPMNAGPMDLRLLVTETVALMRPSLGSGVALDVELPADLPNVYGDDTQIQQVLMNLIRNAAEELADRTGRIRLRGSACDDSESKRATDLSLTPSEATDSARGGKRVILTVDDSGPGVAEALRERIFDPFFSTKGTGRGLGLGTAVGIVRRHGGDLRLEVSDLGGARFVMTLPSAVATERRHESQQVLPSFRGRGTVVVVDDTPSALIVMQRFVESLGFSTVVARSGREALARIADEHTPNLCAVITDIAMPDGDGLWLLQAVRERHPDLLVVLCSALPLANPPHDAAAKFLQKPFSRHEIESLLREWFDGQ